ncbi:MAG: DUF4253 domain-containing protein [Cyanobacteria bacterium HKST-UBA02]|nr:DUF4253 domain-containing protein [Cyanobacteria bacterium HKST-UBA02]
MKALHVLLSALFLHALAAAPVLAQPNLRNHTGKIPTPLIFKELARTGSSNRKEVTVKAPAEAAKALGFSQQAVDALNNQPGVYNIKVYDFLHELRLANARTVANQLSWMESRKEDLTDHLEQFKPVFEGKEIPTRGLSFGIDDFWKTLPAIRKRLPPGYQVYVIKSDAYMGQKHESAVLMKDVSDEQFIVLSQVAGTRPKVTNQQILEAFKNWKKVNKATVYGATAGKLFVSFGDLTRQIGNLAEQILEVCPNMRSRGISKQQVMAKLVRDRRIELYWY